MKNTQDKKNPIGLWLLKAFDDYAGARCLLLNFLPSGFLLAQQGVEKMLKAYLKIAYPDRKIFIGKNGLKAGEIEVVASHDLVAHARLVEESFPQLNLKILADYQWLLEKLSYCFYGKYPDSGSSFASSTTAWLADIDSLMVRLSLSLPIEESIRWRVGLCFVAWPLVLENQPDPPWSKWVRERNTSFSEAFSEIQSIISAGYSAAYPS
jgi:hypothetical protein